jgi:hypothetical protein
VKAPLPDLALLELVADWRDQLRTKIEHQQTLIPWEGTDLDDLKAEVALFGRLCRRLRGDE